MLGHWCIHPVVRCGALLALPRLGVSARSHISWFQTLISLQEIHIRSWHCQIKSQVAAFACPLRQTSLEVNAKAMSEGVHDSAADIELSRQAAVAHNGNEILHRRSCIREETFKHPACLLTSAAKTATAILAVQQHCDSGDAQACG